MAGKARTRPKAHPAENAPQPQPVVPAPIAKKRMKRGEADARIPAIMDAAAIEFSARGFDATRMDDIARRVGVSKPIIYRHFPTKEALFKALLTRDTGEEFAMIQKRIENYEGPIRPLLLLIIATMKERMPASQSSVMLMMSTPRHLEGVNSVTRETIDPVREALEKAFARAIKRGEMRKCDVVIASKHFFAPALQCIFRIVVLGMQQWHDWDMDRYLDRSTEEFFRAYGIK